MPNRILKETICYSESIKSLSWFQEVFFYRMIVNADDFGRLDGRLEMLQARLFPLRRDITEKAIKDSLDALTTAGMVFPYMVDNKPYLQLTAWEDHQQVRAKRSKFPAPDINGNQMISNVPVIQSLSLSESLSEEGRDLEKPKSQTVPYKKIMDLYHSTCTSYPKIRSIEGKRKVAVQARYKELGGIDGFRELFEKAEESDFMKGENKKGWEANFDWLMVAGNMTKVLEGKYENKEEKPNGTYQGSDYREGRSIPTLGIVAK